MATTISAQDVSCEWSIHLARLGLDHAAVTAVEIQVPSVRDMIKGAPHNEVGAPLCPAV